MKRKWTLTLTREEPMVITMSDGRRVKTFMWDEKHLDWVDVTVTKKMKKWLERAKILPDDGGGNDNPYKSGWG